MNPVSGGAPPADLCRLGADSRAAVERFFLEELDDVALYWRFFRTMTPATVHAYVMQMPFAREGAVFGACRGRRLVGVAELASISPAEACRTGPFGGGCAEFGIAVSARERRQGIARRLLQRVLHYAWARGLKRVQMASLKGNHPMLHLAESLGFRTLREQDGEVILQTQRPALWVPPQGIEEEVAADAAAPDGAPERNCTVRTMRGCCQ